MNELRGANAVMPSGKAAEEFVHILRSFWRNSRAWCKWMGASSWAARSKRLSLCETLSLGEKRFVAVVRFEDRQFLLGGTGHSIALLAQLPPDTSWSDSTESHSAEISQQV